METIGRLDVEIFKVVSTQIVTDEVVITEERIAHIQKHHPNDYERFHSYIPDMIEHPELIIEDPRPNTAMVLKGFRDKELHFRLALRLVTAQDAPGYKNSVITFMKIREKEWKRLLKNKKILYKSE